MHNKAFFRRFGSLIILLVFIIITSIGIYFGSDYLFALENIEVAPDTLQVTVNEDKMPKNLLFFPAGKVREDILRDNPILASLQLKKKFPHTLVIIAKRREPIAIIRLESIVGLIDREGYIVGIDDGTAFLPRIALEPFPVAVGQHVIDQSVRAALTLIAALPQEYTVQQITRFDRLSIMGELGEINIIIPQDIDPDNFSSTLQTILSGFRIKGSMPTRIDLRFDKPIIQF
ncbi:hypothetical protein A2875_01295 [Candidatus Gottesmanbacteria bacterium RIFCSPHIGHO2_01_FULL_46_14]|uniref:Uncharacterized protein n=3 Tax=Candidatus Gottesmaniibacteriota TaxID=1752720 RepID=A0A1F5ZQT3_9BACT|nr:MAG: Polypeptide-transport protein FtsQ [Candidatus Gottesmanbacteria bacterium GW2011_GWA1_47_8]OGG14866.1 MAG: hypothetical protein A2875_01295 [Candidatus Gottesmanbacteria bacterium RIFCSPHIGHO2_01_FULL_46_14]OGG29259.1 MAG: hypothetical protein A2971_01585 [Candidatus Gottesmanbacteria bacterium RIFCSPLOWO2_01_FULL_46_21]